MIGEPDLERFSRIDETIVNVQIADEDAVWRSWAVPPAVGNWYPVAGCRS